MKKFYCFMLAVCAVSALHAQVRFGVKGGLNIANEKISLNYMGTKLSKSGDAIPSFHIGGVVEVPISKHFSFRPELLLSGKGSDLDAMMSGSSTTSKAKVRPYYLELPLNVVYRHQFPSHLTFFGGVGPSLAYGIFGKAKASGQSEDVFGDQGYKRFDFGLNILAGIELRSGLTLGVNVTPGLANISSTTQVDPGIRDIKFTNFTFGVSVGYMFSR